MSETNRRRMPYRLDRIAASVYHWAMKKFIAANGCEVEKVVTPSGINGFIPTSIPREALIGMRDALLRDLGVTLEEFRLRHGYAHAADLPPSR